MANYTAADVKALREKSGAGMMDCKSALDEANGDIEKAFEVLRLKGLKGVSKREGRATSNGLVVARTAAGKAMLLELACETDFVAKAENFVALAEQIADAAFASGAKDVATALASSTGGKSVADAITDQAAILGEKVELRRIAVIEAPAVDAYLHRTSRDLPPQVGVLLGYEGSNSETAHDIAVHIAAFSPQYLTRDEVEPEVVAKEREIATETARNEGKPEAALAKIVEGRVNGFFKETCLVDQDFAKDNKSSVGKVAEQAGLKLTGFVRYRVGA
jgi:elongation factor Ts